MLPANPQAQSLSQAPNRAAGSATSGGGMHATAHTPNGNTLLLGVNPAAGQSPIGATPVGNFGSGIGMARPMADQGPPSSCTSTGTCTTCPNGSQGDICEGGTGGGYNPDPPPPDGGGGGIPCQGQCGGGGRGPVTPCSKTNIKACVATDPNSAPSGGQCDSSPANDAVGTGNLGAGTTWGTTIANVYGFANANNTVVYGWAYETENQHMFFQTNSASGGVGILLGFFQNVPGLSNIANAIIASTTGPYQVTGQQWENIQTSMQSSSFKLHKCWAKNYNGGGGTSG